MQRMGQRYGADGRGSSEVVAVARSECGLAAEAPTAAAAEAEAASGEAAETAAGALVGARVGGGRFLIRLSGSAYLDNQNTSKKIRHIS